MPPAKHFPEVLHAAMRHSLFSGGKRLRPILVLAAAEACGAKPEAVMPAACALECIHTYSLIHDDLPCMDDDDLRRGRPTCHKVYGEAAALLAGDALLTFAFELMARVKPQQGPEGPARILTAVRILAQAAGMAGMVGGQMADLEAEGKPADLPMLEYIHTHKTGCLIQASLLTGGWLAGATAVQRKALAAYGENLGLAFQITDDILNVVGEAKQLGKNTGTDAARGKATYPALFGLEESRRRASNLLAAGLKALKPFGPAAESLVHIAKYVTEREV
jgi:geranylgeranyl diphosphate synthase type II